MEDRVAGDRRRDCLVGAEVRVSGLGPCPCWRVVIVTVWPAPPAGATAGATCPKFNARPTAARPMIAGPASSASAMAVHARDPEMLRSVPSLHRYLVDTDGAEPSESGTVRCLR